MRWMALVIGLLLAGCVSVPWSPVGGAYTSEIENFSVELPKGWMRLNGDTDLLITRDGPRLQHIFIERVQVGRPLKNTKKTLARGMMAQAAAEVILDNLASSGTVLDLDVKENRPAQVGGRSGFRLVYTHRNKDGLRFRSVFHGLITGDWFYGIRYTAAERHYFAKDLGTFERVLATFRVIKAG